MGNNSFFIITSPILPHFVFFFFLQLILQKTMAVDPTEGFVSLPKLNQSNFYVESPRDVPQDQRYQFLDGVHRLWVFKTDKPYAHTIKTNPRTEIRISGYDYSSGIWQFEGYGFVPNGTSGVRIMQVFRLKPHSTTFMLRLYNGSLLSSSSSSSTTSYYNNNRNNNNNNNSPVVILVSNLYDRWFRLNVIHDVRDRTLQVYVDGFLILETAAAAGVRGGGNGISNNIYYFFKFGVYAQADSSYYMESRWKNIKVFKKSVS